MTILQTQRYTEILDKRGAQGSLVGISPECVKAIFEHIHEESVQQLSELAKMFMSEVGDGSDSAADEPASDGDDGGSSDSGGMPDIETILKLTSLAGAFTQNDKNADLLLEALLAERLSHLIDEFGIPGSRCGRRGRE